MSRSIEIKPYRNGRAIYVDGRFVSDHYSQDSLAAAYRNIVEAERAVIAERRTT